MRNTGFYILRLALWGHNLRPPILSSLDRVAPGGTVWVALRTELDEGRHTYWRNPGDSGEPVQLSWVIPQGAKSDPFPGLSLILSRQALL